MWMFRLLLLPPMAVVELLLLSATWAIAFVRPDIAKKITDWACARLPTRSWYVGM